MRVTLQQLSQKDFIERLQKDLSGVLVKAAKRNNWEEVLKLLSSKVKLNVNVEIDDNKGIPLHFAASDGQKEVVEKLLKADAEVDKEDNNGNTPLLLAIINRHKEVAEKLIQADADVNKENKAGNTPLYFATRSGDNKLVEKLIEVGAEVNKGNKAGETLLHLAAREGNKEVAALFLAKLGLSDFVELD